ncbi:LOW QUALITY PROTEIN: hypothetical protein RJ639_026615, partial [Escallonia herrerae]
MAGCKSSSLKLSMPLTSQPSPSFPTKNALGDIKDQAEDEANPKPWYMADEKSSKMSTEDLVELLWEYPLPIGWYAHLTELANHGTKYETGIYEEQVKSGYRLPLHSFALCFFEHYHMALGQLVPNSWRKLVGLIYLVQTSGYKPDAIDFMKVFFEIYFINGVVNCPGWYYIHSRQQLLKGGLKLNKGWHSRYFFISRSDKGKLPFDREWNPYCKDFENPDKPVLNNLTSHILSHIKLQGRLSIDEPLLEQKPRERGKKKLPPAPKKTRVIPPEHSPQIVEKVSVKEDPIFRPRWTLRCDDVGMPDSQISEQHLVHGVLPRDKEVFQNPTHKTFACSFAQAVYTMYAIGCKMLSRFEMARQVATEEAQQKREIETLERRLERAKRRVAEEVKKARDQGIRDFLDENAGDEWLKKRADDGLEMEQLLKDGGFDKVWASIPLKKKRLASRQDATALTAASVTEVQKKVFSGEWLRKQGRKAQ